MEGLQFIRTKFCFSAMRFNLLSVALILNVIVAFSATITKDEHVVNVVFSESDASVKHDYVNAVHRSGRVVNSLP